MDRTGEQCTTSLGRGAYDRKLGNFLHEITELTRKIMESLKDVCIERAPHRLEAAYGEIFTKGALQFLQDLFTEFDSEVEKVR